MILPLLMVTFLLYTLIRSIYLMSRLMPLTLKHLYSIWGTLWESIKHLYASLRLFVYQRFRISWRSLTMNQFNTMSLKNTSLSLVNRLLFLLKRLNLKNMSLYLKQLLESMIRSLNLSRRSFVWLHHILSVTFNKWKYNIS